MSASSVNAKIYDRFGGADVFLDYFNVRYLITFVGRKQYKQQFLEHLYDVAADSIALPLSEDSLAVTTFRLQLHRYVVLSAQRLQLEKQAENYLQERSDYRHLRTIPGIGAIIALMIIAESGDLTRFAHYRQYLNFCGFNLSASQSG